jgi:hypothetical protein
MVTFIMAMMTMILGPFTKNRTLLNDTKALTFIMAMMTMILRPFNRKSQAVKCFKNVDFYHGNDDDDIKTV